MHKKPTRRKELGISIWSIVLACLVSFASLVGCGGNSKLADVQGVITLDGKPLPDAFVLFVPISSGATSYGKTDAAGKYRMRFSDTQNGAFIGNCRVVIRTGDVKPDNTGVIPELVPIVYNEKTTLAADVKSGKNTFDWELKSDAGKVQQFKADGR